MERGLMRDWRWIDRAIERGVFGCPLLPHISVARTFVFPPSFSPFQLLFFLLQGTGRVLQPCMFY